MKICLFSVLIIVGFSLKAQKSYQNKEGGYSIYVPASWTVSTEGSTTDIYSPDGGLDDLWREAVGISTGEANGLSLSEAFEYFITEDFPGYYEQFKVLKKGEAVINGVNARWALYSYSASSTVNNEQKSAVIYNLFYLLHKNDTLYFLNAVTEESHYAEFEEIFKKIITSVTLK